MRKPFSWRNLIARAGGKSTSSNRLRKECRPRALSFQSLEPRELMAGDLHTIQHVPAGLQGERSNGDHVGALIRAGKENSTIKSIGIPSQVPAKKVVDSPNLVRSGHGTGVGAGNGPGSGSEVVVRSSKTAIGKSTSSGVSSPGAGKSSGSGTGSGFGAFDSGSGSGAGQSPVILNFSAEEGVTEWTFTGDVIENNQNTAGLTVTFGGLLAGYSTTVLAGGFFDFAIDLPPGLNGTVSAQTVDQNGHLSNIATDFIST